MDTSINSNYEITFTNTDRGSSQNIFKNFAVSGQSTVVADSNNDTLTLVAGSNVSLTTNATNDSITINATDTNTNNYVSSISFNTSNGVLTLNRSGLSSLTVDLDGRYLTGNQTISLTGDVTGRNGTTSQFLRSDGDGTFSWATPTDTNTNNYVTSASFNTGNGVLTLNRSGLSAVTVDLDGRYLTSYTETDTLQSVTSRGASTTVRSNFTGGLNTNNLTTRDKISVYTGAPYVIGMQSGITYGHLNDWGMTFQFNNDNDRGFWWGDDGHSQAQGAMSLTTNGRLTVATSISVGQGESITSAATHPLYVDGTAVFDTTSNTEPVCISRSGSVASQVLKIGVTDTVATFNYIEDTSSEGTGNFGKYQFYLGGNAGESNIMPLEITKDYSNFGVPLRIGGNNANNELDDYEEGTYNITFTVGSTSYTATTTNFGSSLSNQCKYVKVGRIVTIFIKFQFSAHPYAWNNSSSLLYMSNLPFTPLQGTLSGGCMFSWIAHNDVPAPSSVTLYRFPDDYGHVDIRQGYNSNFAYFYRPNNVTGYYSYFGESSMLAGDWPGNNPSGYNYFTGAFTYYTTS